MKNFIIFFPNAEYRTKISADSWDIDNAGENNLLSFYNYSNDETSEKLVIAVFNMNNILGFREIKDN